MARKGIFGRFRDWFLGSPDDGEEKTTGPVLSTVEFEPPDRTDPIVIPALDDVFDLHLIAHFRWSSGQMPLDTLETRSRAYDENARSTLLHRAWETARGFDPASTLEAEKAINAAIMAGWCYHDDAGMIQCTPSVRVLLDPRLREHLAPFQTHRISMEEQHQLGTLKAEHAEALTERWLTVMKTLERLDLLGRDERQFLVPFAANLADGDLAKVMQALASTRRQRATDLADVLSQASRNHEQAGLFEFANAYDKALRTFCRQMGISPYAWALSDFGGAEQQEEST